MLSKDAAVPIWGLLPDSDGGVYVRVVEEGYRKGWPALAIKKVYPDGRMEPFLDFGELYAVRRTFGPWECVYSLQFDAQRNIILAALPLQAVYQVAPGGKIRWEAGSQPQGGADAISFLAPRQAALDSQGRIWVVDSETDKIYCLSPQGKLLLEYGGPATWDDSLGAGFSHPTRHRRGPNRRCRLSVRGRCRQPADRQVSDSLNGTSLLTRERRPSADGQVTSGQ